MNFRLNPVHCGVALLCLSFSASAVAQESAAELKARIKELEAQLDRYLNLEFREPETAAALLQLQAYR